MRGNPGILVQEIRGKKRTGIMYNADLDLWKKQKAEHPNQEHKVPTHLVDPDNDFKPTGDKIMADASKWKPMGRVD